MSKVEVKFPLVEDIRMDVANKFGMVHPDQSNIQAVRAVFIIDPKAVFRTILYYPFLPAGTLMRSRGLSLRCRKQIRIMLQYLQIKAGK